MRLILLSFFTACCGLLQAQVIEPNPIANVPQANDRVMALAFNSGSAYVGGQFTTLGGQSRLNLAAFNESTGQVTGFNPGVNGPVSALAVHNGILYVGGQFTTAAGQSRTNLAAFNLSTGQLTSWSPSTTITTGSAALGTGVRCMALIGDILYIGGGFATAAGVPRGGLASFNLSNTSTNFGLTAWDPNLYGGWIPAGLAIFVATGLHVVGGNIAVVGACESVGGAHWDGGSSPHAQLGNLTAVPILLFSATGTGAVVASWLPAFDSNVDVCSVYGSTIYCAGQSTKVTGGGGTVTRNCLAALDTTVNTTTTNPATSWDPNANNRSQGMCITQDGELVVVSGTFTQVGGQSHNQLVAINRATGAPTSWNASVDVGGLVCRQNAGRIYIGGLFTQVNGSARSGLCAFNYYSPVAITTSPTLPQGTAGLAFAHQFAAGGGAQPHAWSASGLPTGWRINATGLLEATSAYTTPGTFQFTARVDDNVGQYDELLCTVNIVAQTLGMITSSLPSGTAGVAYTTTLSATGGWGAYTWSVTGSNLPAGFGLNAATGEISAAAASVVAGSYSFTVTVEDAAAQMVTRAFNLAVAAAGPPLTITTGAILPNGLHGVQYLQTITATGGQGMYGWVIYNQTPLPAGWSLHNTTGVLSAPGGSVAAGSYQFTLIVQDNWGTASKAFDLTVDYPLVSITPGTLADAQEGVAYGAALQAFGGTGISYAWTLTAGALPAGLGGVPGSGATVSLTGTPGTAGSETFTVRVTDNLGNFGEQSFTLTVAPAAGGSGGTHGPTERPNEGCAAHAGAGTFALLALLALACQCLRRRRTA